MNATLPTVPDFPGFEPVEQLYEGDHGAVWKVRDVQRDELVVLKFLYPDAPADVRAGLGVEARLHAGLRHPGVVRMLDIVEGAQGTALVTELVDGPSLADVLDTQGPPPLGAAVRLFEDVVRAVRAVHARGVVHRDLKPENILLRPTPDGPAPVLVDFGLAKKLATDGTGRTEQGMSMWFSTLGTPEYMAPEQADSPSAVDERADLFSLGCLLYELLCGRVAFDAEDPDDAMSAVAAGDYVPVEQVVSVPNGLARLVRDLLSARPEDRPPHCTALLRRLDGSHDG